MAKEADQEEKTQDTIWFSDVVMRNRRDVFWRRNWNVHDITRFGVVLSMHLLGFCAPFYFTWPAFWLAAGLHLGDPIDWVSTHRCHHQFCDTERDPHSPIHGFWFSHIKWIFDTKTLSEKRGETSNVEDLEKQPFYRFLQATYYLHPFAFGIVLYALGGFPFLVLGMGVRVVYTYHATFLVGSVSHMRGNQPWNTGDQSKNNWWVALLSLGEGWHNNHHAFEYSARHGLEWWQLDLTWHVIRFFHVIGREVFWRRNWNAYDITNAGVFLSMHLLALCAPSYFTWHAFWVAAGLYLRGETSNVEDLEKQPFYMFIQATYLLHPIAFVVVLYAFGGFPFLAWEW
ncbi:hypothetical protein V6N13_144310 [Hibiscus sabdariffa]